MAVSSAKNSCWCFMRACSFASQDINCHTIPHATLATLSSPIQHIHLVAVRSAYQLFILRLWIYPYFQPKVVSCYQHYVNYILRLWLNANQISISIPTSGSGYLRPPHNQCGGYSLKYYILNEIRDYYAEKINS